MAKGTTSTPHDAVFKQFLTQADTARDFLAIHLPPALRQRCDLDTLQLESASFIEESLRAWYSDVLWSLKTASGEGYIYVVIEHQSSPDAQMAFRLMPVIQNCRWWCRCCSITERPRHTRGHSTGWTVLPIHSWRVSFISRPFRWWMSR